MSLSVGSAFFSFNFYFNQLFERGHQGNIVYAELPQQLSTAIMPDLIARVKGAYVADAERFVAEPVTVKWVQRLEGIATQAKAARSQIASAVQKQEADRRRA